MHVWLYWLGLTNPASTPYLFWSGFGGCLRDMGALGIILWRSRPVHHHHHYYASKD